MQSNRNQEATWNQKFERFENLGDEPMDVGGRVLVPVDEEVTVRLVLHNHSHIRRWGSALLPQWSQWQDFRHTLADLLERCSAWVRP
jgi:hypothetical protein